MKCPTDSATLIMSERSGVEIDYCPECRGVWLDRGELDKILERAEAEMAASASPPPPAPTQSLPSQYPDPRFAAPGYGDRERPFDSRESDYGRRGREYDDRGGHRGRKKESWLSDLFD